MEKFLSFGDLTKERGNLRFSKNSSLDRHQPVVPVYTSPEFRSKSFEIAIKFHRSSVVIRFAGRVENRENEDAAIIQCHSVFLGGNGKWGGSMKNRVEVEPCIVHLKLFCPSQRSRTTLFDQTAVMFKEPENPDEGRFFTTTTSTHRWNNGSLSRRERKDFKFLNFCKVMVCSFADDYDFEIIDFFQYDGYRKRDIKQHKLMMKDWFSRASFIDEVLVDNKVVRSFSIKDREGQRIMDVSNVFARNEDGELNDVCLDRDVLRVRMRLTELVSKGYVTSQLKDYEFRPLYLLLRAISLLPELYKVLESVKCLTFKQCYSCFKELCEKGEEHEIFRNWFESDEKKKTSIREFTPETFKTSLGLSLFNRMNGIVDFALEEDPELFQVVEGVVFTHLKRYKEILDPREHKDFPDFPHDWPVLGKHLYMYMGRREYHKAVEKITCPLTQEVMDPPYKAPCGHHYSSAVFDYLGGQSKICVLVGCHQTLSRHLMKVNIGFGRRIKRRLEKERHFRRRSRGSDRKGVEKSTNIKLISSEGKEFDCHVEMLVLEMNFFHRMLRFGGKELEELKSKGSISLEGLDSKVVEKLIEFVYNRRFLDEEGMPMDVLVRLLVQGEMYDEYGLMRACMDCLRKKNDGDEEENYEEIIMKFGHLIHTNDSLKRDLVPILARWCGKEFSKSQIVDLIRSSFENHRFENVMDRLDQLERKNENLQKSNEKMKEVAKSQKSEIEKLRRKQDAFEAEMEKLRSSLFSQSEQDEKIGGGGMKRKRGESEDDEEEGKENKDEPPLKKIKKE